MEQVVTMPSTIRQNESQGMRNALFQHRSPWQARLTSNILQPTITTTTTTTVTDLLHIAEMVANIPNAPPQRIISEFSSSDVNVTTMRVTEDIRQQTSKKRKHLRMDQLVLIVLPDSSAEWIAVRAPLRFLTDSMTRGLSSMQSRPTKYEQKWRRRKCSLQAVAPSLYIVSCSCTNTCKGAGQSAL